MSVIGSIKDFISSGWQTFRLAARGMYDGESEAVSDIRREMFSQPSGRMRDAENLRHDRQMIIRDMRTAYEEIVLANG